MRLLGLTDEQRLEIEEATGIKTEGVKLLMEAARGQAQELAQQLIDTSIREVQGVIGPHGSVTRLQAGGVNISQSGVSVYQSGVLKTTIQEDGDFLAGSDITLAASTSFCVFVNEQTYNNEAMGAGDILIGDNTTGVSNVKYDASEGQLQFRLGTIVNVYVDTDGSLKAGGGEVLINSSGISINLPEISTNDVNAYKFVRGALSYGGLYAARDTPAITTTFYLISNVDANALLNILMTGSATGKIFLEATGAGRSVNIYLDSSVNPPVVRFNNSNADADLQIKGDIDSNVFYVDGSTDRVGIGTASPSAKLNVEGDVIINDTGADKDTRIEGDTDANLLFTDASTDRVGIGTNAPGYKFDTAGDVNISSGSVYRINGTTVVSGTITGVTNGDSHDHSGGDGASIPLSALTGSPSTWSPTWTNLTVGNGTLTTGYVQIGKLVIGHLELVFGSTSSISGDVSLTMPVNISSSYGGTLQPLGFARLLAGGAGYVGVCQVGTSANTFRVVVSTASGTYVQNAALSSTVPGTWTTGDVIQIQFFYYAA